MCSEERERHTAAAIWLPRGAQTARRSQAGREPRVHLVARDQLKICVFVRTTDRQVFAATPVYSLLSSTSDFILRVLV